MFNQYHPNVKVTSEFLRLLKVKVNSTTVNETLQNHPDWPSLLCISDTLNKWHIPNGAGKIDPVDIDQLPTPFIASTNDFEAPMAIVTRVTDTTVQIQKAYNKSVNENRKDFIKKWQGIYLIAEPNEGSGELNYEKIKNKSLLTSLIPIVALAVLVLFSFLLISKVVNTVGNLAPFVALGIYLQYFIMFVGVVISGLLVWYEVDKYNPFIKKICTGFVKSDCNAILTGKHAKIFNWLSWSEVGLFFFLGGLLTLLSVRINTFNLITVVAWMNVLALPYAVFSVYYQWQVAKQWCALCLAIQALLLLGGINVIANNFLFPFSSLTVSLIANLTLLYLLPVLLWYALKPYLLRLQEVKGTKRQYLRLKFNNEIFETHLKNQKPIIIPTEGLGIDLGNPKATNTLIKVCSTYCGPCSEALPKIEKLLKENNNLKVKIIFTVPNGEQDPAIKPVRHLLAIAEQANEVKVQKALDDWYLSNVKDYGRFAALYPMNGELLKQGDKIDAMRKWCKATSISYTPAIFFNGYQLPDDYDIEDLQYFLLESPSTEN